MAISAVSSISAGGLARLFRSPIPGSAADRSASVTLVQAIPALAGREDSRRNETAASVAEDDKAERSSPAALDPRRPESILSWGRADTRREDTRREVNSRLDDLLAQKAAIEGREAEQKGESSAEVVNELAQLKARDSQVRAHEAAHIAAGGRYITGGASYIYQEGPDGGEYAVGGEVGIDTSSVPGNPEETAQKMRIVRAAALAPSDPSAADLSVAAAAAEAESAALAEIAQARSEEIAGRYGREAAATPAGGDRGEGRGARNPLDMVA
jgi:hypothetical protein